MAGPLANRTPSGPGAMAGAAEALGWLAVCFAAAAAAAGLFVPTLYRDVAGWVQQAQGADLSTLVLAIPLSVVAGRAAARGSTAGRLATLGVLLYLAYTYAVSAFSVAINPLTVVYIAVLGLSVWASLLTAASVDTTAANRLVDARLPRRASATFLVVIAVLFGLLWLGQLATVALTGRPPEELVRLRLPTNPIY
ncbi:MAG TPA: hypothetical protein VFI28_06985, partial [Candidatus Limnocylindrales bacterium]|nr:hypothetical protein [Candidatus Limnocylindrales bacterium]